MRTCEEYTFNPGNGWVEAQFTIKTGEFAGERFMIWFDSYKKIKISHDVETDDDEKLKRFLVVTRDIFFDELERSKTDDKN